MFLFPFFLKYSILTLIYYDQILNTGTMDKNDSQYEHNLMEALWAYQWQNVVNEPLLLQMLKADDYHARAAAVRVLCYWRDRVSKPLDLLRTAATDDSPRVRLEAVRASPDGACDPGAGSPSSLADDSRSCGQDPRAQHPAEAVHRAA